MKIETTMESSLYSKYPYFNRNCLTNGSRGSKIHLDLNLSPWDHRSAALLNEQLDLFWGLWRPINEQGAKLKIIVIKRHSWHAMKIINHIMRWTADKQWILTQSYSQTCIEDTKLYRQNWIAKVRKFVLHSCFLFTIDSKSYLKSIFSDG